MTLPLYYIAGTPKLPKVDLKGKKKKKGRWVYTTEGELDIRHHFVMHVLKEHT